MKVYISYNHHDKNYAKKIAERLRKEGHKVLNRGTQDIDPGDNIILKTDEDLKNSDALIVIVSKYALQSEQIMQEYSAMALGNLSSGSRKVIPVLVDDSTVPGYLSSQYIYIDLTADIAIGIQRIVDVLSSKPKKKSPGGSRKKPPYDTAITNLSRALRGGYLTLICGAGISSGAGVPTWNLLLVRLLGSMLKKISVGQSNKEIDPAVFQERYGTSSLIIGKYLKTNLGNDYMPELRKALYSEEPITCELIEVIAEMARPSRDSKPLESIITFNFDGLLEEQLEKNKIYHKPIYSEGERSKPNELPIYHVHGYLPRDGQIEEQEEVVFSEDAYHGQFIDSFSWSNLIQLNKLSHNICLFIGLSLTDPNLRRLLDIANRRNPSESLNHYIVKTVPNASKESDSLDKVALLLEEQDAIGLGLNVVWVDDYSSVPEFLRTIMDYSS